MRQHVEAMVAGVLSADRLFHELLSVTSRRGVPTCLWPASLPPRPHQGEPAAYPASRRPAHRGLTHLARSRADRLHGASCEPDLLTPIALLGRQPTAIGIPHPSDIARPTTTVTAASLSENAVGIRLLAQAKKTYPTISKSWVDTGFKNAVVEHGANLGIDVEVVNRNPDIRSFHVVKRRWAVERNLGWIMLRRRLARDYEILPASSGTMIHIASIDSLAKRITDETTPTWRGTC